MSRKRLKEIADRHTPKRVRVKSFHERREGAMAFRMEDYTGIIVSNRIETRTDLLHFLHECAHFHLGHFRSSKYCCPVQEYEAEAWAIRVMRRNGIEPPARAVRRAREYVLECLVAHADPRVRRFVKELI